MEIVPITAFCTDFANHPIFANLQSTDVLLNLQKIAGMQDCNYLNGVNCQLGSEPSNEERLSLCPFQATVTDSFNESGIAIAFVSLSVCLLSIHSIC